MANQKLPSSAIVVDRIEAARDDLTEGLGSGKNRKYIRFTVAALGGIPWVGGLIAASAALSGGGPRTCERASPAMAGGTPSKGDGTGENILDIFARLESFGDTIEERIGLLNT